MPIVMPALSNLGRRSGGRIEMNVWDGGSEGGRGGRKGSKAKRERVR